MRIRYEGRMWDVYLLDDGTLDTVIKVRRIRDNMTFESRFDGEYASQYRHKDGSMSTPGLIALGKETADAMLEVEGYELTEIVKGE